MSDYEDFSSEDTPDDATLPDAPRVELETAPDGSGLVQKKDPFLDDEGLWFRAKGYTVNENGIFREVVDAKTKEPRTAEVHPWAIAPVEVHDAVNEQGKKQFVSVLVRYQTATGDVEETLVPLDDLEMVGQSPFVGWPKPDSGANKSHVIRALFARIKSGLPKKTSFTCCGWVRFNGVLEHIRPGHPLFVSRVDAEGIPANMGQEGDLKVWRTTYNKMVQDSPLFAYLSAIAFGGYARSFIRRSSQHSHIIYLGGERSRGKSTILLCLASIQGAPVKGQTVFDSKSTAVGVERALPYFRHGPFFLDEMDDVLRDGNGMEKLMFWANNGGRIKAAQQGGLSVGSNWDSPLLTTGNTNLEEHPNFKKDMKAGAVKSRLEQHDIMDPVLHGFRDMEAVRHYLATLSGNYGHGYPLVIDALKKAAAEAEEANADRSPDDDEPPEPNRYEARYNAFFNDLSNDESLRDLNAEMRLAEHLGFAMVGAELMKDVLGRDAWDAAMEAIALVLDRYRLAPAEASSGDESAWDEYERALQFVSTNAGKFIWEGYAYDDQGNDVAQKLQAEALTRAITAATTGGGGAYGVVLQNRPMKDRHDFSGEIVLFDAGTEALTRFGGLDSLQLVQSLRKLGVLYHKADAKGQSKNAPSQQKRWGGKWTGVRFDAISRLQFMQRRAAEAQASTSAPAAIDALDDRTAALASVVQDASAAVAPLPTRGGPSLFPRPGQQRAPSRDAENEHEQLVDALFAKGAEFDLPPDDDLFLTHELADPSDVAEEPGAERRPRERAQ